MSSSPSLSSSSELDADPLGPLFDVHCAIDIVLGTGVMKLRECLRLDCHSIVRLGQSAGSDLEVRVHGVTVAVGEVVIVDDNTALRLSHIHAPAGIEAM